MPRISVLKKFELLHNDGVTETFLPGMHDVPEEVANHWYVQLHTAEGKDAENPILERAQAAANGHRSMRTVRQPLDGTQPARVSGPAPTGQTDEERALATQQAVQTAAAAKQTPTDPAPADREPAKE